jgi:outer membrane receptor for ferrienterochelin and colicins
MGSGRVLILMNGEPFIGRISGQVDLSRIPTSMIERIEVVKGPQSTLYGSEAMGGVVNVITRVPLSRWTGDLQMTAGGQGRLDLDVGATGSLAGVHGIATLGRRTLDEISGISSGGGNLSERWDGQGQTEWRSLAKGVRIEVGGVLLDESQRWSSGQLFYFADNLQWSGRALVEIERGEQRIVATAFATAFEHLTRRATIPTPFDGAGDEETQRLNSVDLLYARSFGGHALDLGIEAEREAIRSDRVVDAARVSETLEIFGQATLALGPVTLLPGARATRSDLWGDHITPRVALLYRPTSAWSLRLSAGEGFRAPDFKETHIEFLNVGSGFAYTVRGNPDLGPEISRNLTASIEWAGERTYLRLQGFHNNFDGFIETVAIGDSSGVQIYTYGNIDDGYTRGVEVEVGVVHGGWRLEVGRSWLRAERRDTGEPLLGRPLASSRALLSFAHPVGTRFSLTGVHTGRTGMSRTGEGIEWRDDFLRFDLRISQSLPGGIDLSLGVDNLFRAREEQWPGFTDRHLYTTLSWRPFQGR